MATSNWLPRYLRTRIENRPRPPEEAGGGTPVGDDCRQLGVEDAESVVYVDGARERRGNEEVAA